MGKDFNKGLKSPQIIIIIFWLFAYCKCLMQHFSAAAQVKFEIWIECIKMYKAKQGLEICVA